MTTATKFSIGYTGFINADGDIVNDIPETLSDPALVLALYRLMVLTRTFDDKAIKLQRTGKMGTYPSVLGQEAVAVGYGKAMQADDVLAPYYRDQGAQIQRGSSMSHILRYWGGDERGSNFDSHCEDFPISVPIATQNLHAVGIAKAIQYRKQQRAVVTTIGEGGTSEGDFYEALNVAGAWQLPVVFVINNNQWAISVARDVQTGCQTIAQKAIAGGLDGYQVDGNDVLAVYHVAQLALERARNGGGASVIEAITYRLGDHTTADDASRYRPDDELQQAWQQEPIGRLKRFMEKQHGWNDSKDAELKKNCQADVDAAVDAYLKTPKAPISDMFDYLYANLPNELAWQRETALYYGESHD